MVGLKIGFLFPGQGAQYVGMGKEWGDRYETVRRYYEEADERLGFSISKICFDGPEETLTRTLYAQPAIFVTSLAIFSVIEERLNGVKMELASGLSLGEFSALVAARSLTFAEGLKLVKRRAELMECAASHTSGTMLSILGLNQTDCEQIAKESGAELANLNSPEQFVLSGEASAVEKAAALAEKRGAKRALRLKVGGAFHSALMGEAKEGLREALKKISIQSPQCIFIPNACGEEVSDPEQIRVLLADQLTLPVQWIKTIQRAQNRGIRRFIEPGPGRVLKGLAKKIDASVEVFSLDKISDLETIESIFEQTKP